MEPQDWKMVAADCLVISCCCQCLILEILVSVLLKLPSKLVRKTTKYMKRKFRRRKMECYRQRHVMRAGSESFRLDDDDDEEEFHGCMEEVEKVLEELAMRGEFGFGSFWNGDVDLEVHFPICLVNQELGYHDHLGNFHLVEVIGPFGMH